MPSFFDIDQPTFSWFQEFALNTAQYTGSASGTGENHSIQARQSK
jgi:hypothetical protein